MDQVSTRSAWDRTVRSHGSQSTKVASIPVCREPGWRCPATRWPPRVEARKAARSLIRCAAGAVRAAARTQSQGSAASAAPAEPKASGVPSASRSR